MIIKVLENFKKDKIIVFVLKEKDLIQKHSFWKLFDAYDQQYILNFLKINKLKPGSYYNFILPSKREIFIFGEVENSKFNHRKAIILARKIVFVSRQLKKTNLILNFDDFKSSDFLLNNLDLAQILATQFEIANFEFTNYKNPPKEGWSFVEEIQIAFNKKEFNLKELEKALNNGKIIGEEINEARKLANTPGGDMTPQKLAEFAKNALKNLNVKVKVLNKKEIDRVGMGGIIGVSRGSSEEPRFIIAEYLGGSKNERPIILIGKGITFDSGGLNLKPSEGIYEMHMDMTGGAVVIHLIKAFARLKIKRNIIGIVPACENMPSGSSYRPGDILKTLSGKTIEVLNTDAEGRIVLADALEYAQKYYNPSLIIDLATLTGAAIVALGQRASAIFSNKNDLIFDLQKAGEVSGDFVWPLPLWEEYEEEVKGTFGDIANIGKTKYGGAIIGATFLHQFVKESGIPWMHIDIAPRMTSIDGEFLAKGSTAPGLALIVNFILNFYK
jgi:leucyl aminopeptidase